MNNNKYEQPLISKHFNFPKDTALRQNNAVQQTHSTNTTKTDNVNEPQNDADAEVKMKIAPEAEKIDAFLMLKLFLDRNSGEDFLRIEPNKCMFWYNCDIPNAVRSVNKMPDKEFWKEKIAEAQKYIPNEGYDRGKLRGEYSSRIVAESIEKTTIRMLMNTVDSGNVQNVWKLASGIFALHAEGTVFLLTNNTVDAKNGGGTWKSVERPQIMKNPSVDMVIELDFYNPDKVNSIMFPHGMRDALKNCTFQIPISILGKEFLNAKKIPENSLIPVNELFHKEYKDAAEKAFSQPFKLEYTDNGIDYKLIDTKTGNVKNSDEDIAIEDIPKLVKGALYAVYANFSKDNNTLEQVSQLLKTNKHTNYEKYWNALLAKNSKRDYNNEETKNNRQNISYNDLRKGLIGNVKNKLSYSQTSVSKASGKTLKK